jgi:hypothetical protein
MAGKRVRSAKVSWNMENTVSGRVPVRLSTETPANRN